MVAYMGLETPAFRDGMRIPAEFTCDGEDASPPLHWSDPPEGARSFVVLREDPDAPGGTWHHWAAYDASGYLRSLAKRAARRAHKLGFKQAVNDFRRADCGAHAAAATWPASL